MKTIELPKIKEIKQPRLYRVRCANSECLALLELKYSELAFTRTVDNERHCSYVMICPHCHNATLITPTQLNALQIDAPDRHLLDRLLVAWTKEEEEQTLDTWQSIHAGCVRPDCYSPKAQYSILCAKHLREALAEYGVDEEMLK
jgi:hypothetical protein